MMPSTGLRGSYSLCESVLKFHFPPFIFTVNLNLENIFSNSIYTHSLAHMNDCLVKKSICHLYCLYNMSEALGFYTASSQFSFPGTLLLSRKMQRKELSWYLREGLIKWRILIRYFQIHYSKDKLACYKPWLTQAVIRTYYFRVSFHYAWNYSP